MNLEQAAATGSRSYDPMFSLVMPCYNCNKTIKKAIESILDQDYENWELICVVNGQWEDREKLVKVINQYVKKDPRVRIRQLDEGNACTARNHGAEWALGDYISFFSSDFVMFPGALTKWKNEFEKRDCDWIYSGYELFDGDKTVGYCPTRPFDAYVLQTMNYIDGGFPMKREVWEKGKWDPDCKSLNDWDFWLTAVDNGFKGKMVPDITYSAQIPKQGGLSFDSHQNWLERLEWIKKKHNIPIRELCVVSLGAQTHGIKMAKILNADFSVAPMMKPNRYKSIYLIGFYVGNGDSAIAHSKVFDNFKGKQIVHWIGTDILQIIQAGYKVCYNDMKMLLDQLNRRKNLSEFEQTKGELASIGLESDIIPLPVENPPNLIPLPKEFTIATYVPKTSTATQIYNLDLLKDIIKSCPDIKFVTFGGGGIEHLPNVSDLGWCDINKVIEKSSMLLRLTYHDGLPIAPIEFRLAGRDAMTTVQMKYIYFAGDGIIHKDNYSRRKEAIIKMIRDIKKEQKKSGVKEVKEAREYYLKLTDPKEYKKKIDNIWMN